MRDINFKIHKFDEVTSTNDVLREMAYNGCEIGTVLVADSQTKGKGRMGRTFHSPSGSGLYMSILFGSDNLPFDIFSLTPVAAVVVADAIEKNSHKDVKIKWVNDIYIDERKVCGILAEGVPSRSTGKIESIILGIGINLLQPDGGFNEDIKNKAGAVFSSGEFFDKDKIASDILEGFKNINPLKAKESYKRRDFLKDKKIKIKKIGASDFFAEALGIGDDFSLHVKKDSGEILNLRDEEVSLHDN